MKHSIDLAELIPGLADVRAGKTRLAQLRKDTPPPPTPHQAAAQLARDLAAAAEHGDPFPDTAVAVAEARRAAENHTAALQTVISAEQMLTQREEATIKAGANDALHTLAGTLADVLAGIRDIAPALGAVRTAEQAMDAGPVARDAYPVARGLLGEYVAIRAAQRTLTRAGWPSDATNVLGVLKVAGEISNLDEIWPCWPRATTSNGYLDKTTNTLTLPPWPEDADPFEGRYSLAYLLWAANSDTDAHVWMPTTIELREAYDHMHAEVNKRERIAEQNAGLGRPQTEYVPTAFG